MRHGIREGSSPRMRGSRYTIKTIYVDDGIIPAHAGLTEAAALVHPRTRGIIPAHAGLTLFNFNSRSRKRDHPRACGAHVFVTMTGSGALGSSPRMRGSPSVCGESRDGLGIIPAHAGLTILTSRLERRKRDHPRACGAHYRSSILGFTLEGSSPRMRGSLQFDELSR